MDDRSGLEGVARPLAPHHGGGDLAQLLVDERHQLRGSLLVAAPDLGEQLRHVTSLGHRGLRV